MRRFVNRVYGRSVNTPHRIRRTLTYATATVALTAALTGASPASTTAKPTPGCNRIYVIDVDPAASTTVRLWCSNHRRTSAWFDAALTVPHPLKPLPAVTTGLIAYDSSVRGQEVTFWVVDHGWTYAVSRNLNDASSDVAISPLRRVPA